MIKGSADYLKDYEVTVEVLKDRLEFYQGFDHPEYYQQEIDGYKMALWDMTHALEELREQIVHSEITIEMEQGADIPLGEWARKNGLDESYARKKARRGSLKTAHKVGRDWFINEFEINYDNRRKK